MVDYCFGYLVRLGFYFVPKYRYIRSVIVYFLLESVLFYLGLLFYY